MVRRPTRYKIINVKNAVIYIHKKFVNTRDGNEVLLTTLTEYI